MIGQKHNRQMSCNVHYFFEILFIKTKDTVFCTFQRSHVTGGLNIDASQEPISRVMGSCASV